MEAYFHSDLRIEEWVDQITEKIFTACLLTGIDSEVEFQKGCQIVTKITRLLQGISIFPSEYLEDGLKQLLEQQLPDSRVINNFPTFQNTMNRMLREGMLSAITPENTREDPSANAKRSANLLNDEFVAEELEVITALAPVDSMTPYLVEAEAELQTLEFNNLMAIKNDSSSVITSTPAPSIPTKPYGIIRKSQVPKQADRLKHVLNNIFPNVSVCWNLNLMGQTFLAQVEDILICLSNPEQPCPVENFNKEGWKVYVCNSDDLMYPRRLERGIRQIKRIGKQ